MSAATATHDPLRPPKGPAPFFTVTTAFNAVGWLVLALVAWFLVIPAVRFGNWTEFKNVDNLLFLWRGLQVTLFVGAISVVLSTIFGFLLALGRLSNLKPLRVISSGYIEFVRALPSYLIIFFVFLGFPKLGINLSAPWFAIMGLTMYTTAVMAEIFRAGILSVDKGQLEAAYALGLQPRDTIIQIVLPQAVRKMVPAIVGQLITLTKDTSLASVIALQELSAAGKQLFNLYSGIVLETIFVIAAIYFTICFSLSLLSKKLEVKDLTRA